MISNPTAPNPSKLMAQLRMMPDQQLVQYAQMHKNDPYIFPMAFQESNTRKQMRAAQNPQAAQAPKVVDQDLQNMAQTMPENQGIGTLPAPNMQNMAGGGIVAFDDGGEVPGYAGGIFTKTDTKQAFATKYHDAAVLAGQELGVDPGIIISQWGLETGWGKSIIPGTNNLGNIKDFSGKGTQAYDKAEKSNSKYRTYDSPEAFAKDYVNLIKLKYPDSVGAGGDATKFVAGLRPGENGGYATDEKYGSKLLTTVKNFLPTATAMAPQAAPAAPTNPAIDQIPGQTRQAPPVQAAPKLKANPLAGLLPPKNDEPYSPLEELQKNVSGALNVAKQVPSNLYNLATSPAEYFKNIDAKNLGPAIIGGFNPSHIGKLGVPSVKTAKAPLTEPAVSTITEPVVSPAVEAARAKQAAARANAQAQFGEPTPTDRQTFPVTPENEGIAAIQKGKLELERQAEAARKTAAPAETTPITPIEAPAVGEKPIHPFDAANATKSRVPSTLPYAEDQNPYVANTTANKYDSGVMGGAPLPSAEDDIVAALRNKPEEVAAAPEEKTGGMDMNRLMLQMGLHLMAGKSPNALTNVGEAGLGTLAMQQAEAKALSDIEAKKSEAEYRKKMGEYYGAYGEAIGRGSKEKNLQLEAEKLIAQEISKDKFINMPGQEAARAAREAQMRSTIYRQLGIEPTMAAGAPAPAGGFSVVGSRPG